MLKGSQNLPGFFIHIVTLLLPMSHFTIKRYSYFPFSKGKREMIVFLVSKSGIQELVIPVPESRLDQVRACG